MKTLFTGYFSVSLSGGLIICLILMLRPFMRKAPKSVICILWALAILRLLLPFQLENPISIRPQTPVITEADTRFVLGTPDIGYLVSPDVVVSEYGQVTNRLDYVAIASLVWGAIAVIILLYTLMSYWYLRLKLCRATNLENGAYVVMGMDSAFLLGYLKPRIYLPDYLNEEQEGYVIAHENAHKRRGDNWLKLAGFVCLGLHWYNPLVWVAYIFLCRDIEDACDDYVVRELDLEGRKAYSAALLSCCRKHKKLPECPVAFGECNITKRIKRVLKYRKPTVWICVAAVVLAVIATFFFFTDPVADYSHRHPTGYVQMKSLLGNHKDVVFAELGLKEDNLETTASNFYNIPLQAEFQGETFDITLGFDYWDDVLWSFMYTKTVDGKAPQAVQTATTVARHYGRYVGTGYNQRLEVPFKDLTVEYVEKVFSNPKYAIVGISYLANEWALLDEVDDQLQIALDECAQTPQWESYSGDFGKKPGYVLSYNAYYNPEQDQTTITMTYKMGPVKQYHYQITTGVPIPWWQKLIEWAK